MTQDGNLFTALAPDAAHEQITSLLATADVRIERIVSYGQASAPGFWFDQNWAEWVIVLSGSAGLLIEGEDGPRLLRAGDYLYLPAHCRHRVEWTSPEEATIWLAVHHRSNHAGCE
jgi:cupin 2 domain-containing protein